MPENTFQCFDKNENLESCKHCGCQDFEMRETLSTAIVCAKCQKFHKHIENSIKSAGEILDGMFEFARKNGE